MLPHPVPSISSKGEFRPGQQWFTPRKASSHTRRRCVRLSAIAQYSPLLPPVGVWAVSQSQCGWPSSQTSYPSCLGGPLPRQLADRSRAPRSPPEVSSHRGLPLESVCGITRPLGRLSPRDRQIAHVLRTRSPVALAGPRDLHVLSTPPAFVLSQDQTLQWLQVFD